LFANAASPEIQGEQHKVAATEDFTHPG